MSANGKHARLNRKFDQIRQMEESGELKNKNPATVLCGSF